MSKPSKMSLKEKRKKSILARWDPEVLKEMRTMVPNVSDATLSKLMFNTSMFRAESFLNKKDTSLSEIVGMKKNGKKKKESLFGIDL